jgi:hypothetical protein
MNHCRNRKNALQPVVQLPEGKSFKIDLHRPTRKKGHTTPLTVIVY